MKSDESTKTDAYCGSKSWTYDSGKITIRASLGGFRKVSTPTQMFLNLQWENKMLAEIEIKKKKLWGLGYVVLQCSCATGVK